MTLVDLEVTSHWFVNYENPKRRQWFFNVWWPPISVDRIFSVKKALYFQNQDRLFSVRTGNFSSDPWQWPNLTRDLNLKIKMVQILPEYANISVCRNKNSFMVLFYCVYLFDRFGFEFSRVLFSQFHNFGHNFDLLFLIPCSTL